MLLRILKRVLQLVPLLVAMSVVVFVLIRLIPGDPAEVMVGFESKDPKALADIRKTLGLDKPLYYQYFIWLTRILHGNFGVSTQSGRPVLGTIVKSLPYTLELAFYALTLALLIGIPLGAIAGTSSSKVSAFISQLFILVGLSLPIFWIGAMFILVFTTFLEWFPVLQYPSFLTSPTRNLYGFFLPSFTAAISNAAAFTRMVRSSVLEIKEQDYIRTARAKGLKESSIILRHIIRNAMIPVTTLVGISLGYMIGGLVVLEQVFAVPGIGRLSVQAIIQRDYPTLQGVVLIVVVGVAIVNLVVDLLYTCLDPRIKYE